MKNGLTVFIAAFVTLGASWTAFVLGAVVQLGHEKNYDRAEYQRRLSGATHRRRHARPWTFIARMPARHATRNKCNRAAWPAMWF